MDDEESRDTTGELAATGGARGIVLDPDNESPMNLVRTPEMSRRVGTAARPSLSGDGHFWITLDYRRGPIPSVAGIDIEIGEDLQVAPSFSAFLEGPGSCGPVR